MVGFRFHGDGVCPGHLVGGHLEDLLTNIKLSHLCQQIVNILPPSHGLELPIVKLLTHPIYHPYQSHIATILLFLRVYLSYVPPASNAYMPPIPRTLPSR